MITKDGYETAYSEWMEVPPERTGVAIPLVSSAVPEVESISADTNAAVVTFSQYMDPDTISEMKLTSADGREVAYTLAYDDSQKDKDGNVFARIYKLVYNKKQEAGSKLTISVPDTVMNYAGNALEAYQKNVVVTNPCSIASEDSIQLAYEEEKTVTVEVSSYREELALTCSSSSKVGLDASVSFVDVDGKAELTLNGIIPGTYQVELAVAGTDTRKTITVTVQEAEMAGETEKEETGTSVGDAYEGNKENEGSTDDGTGDTGTKDPDTGENAGDGTGDAGTGENASGGTGDTDTGKNAGDGTGDTDTGENTSSETGFEETGENFHVHRYANQAKFHWTADGKKCVAVFVCMVSGCGHEESVNAMVRSGVKSAATCTTRGITEYTAEVFFNPMAYSGKGNVVTVRDTKELSNIAVDPQNHTGKTIIKNQRAATYTESGYTGDTVCSACGKTVRKGKGIGKKTLAKPARVTVKSSKKNVLVVSWKKSRDASGYEIQYAADKDFRKAETVKVKSGKTKKTIKN